MENWININNLPAPKQHPVLVLFWNDWSDIPLRRVSILEENNVWYDVSRASAIDGIVTHWAEMPSKEGMEEFNPYKNKG